MTFDEWSAKKRKQSNTNTVSFDEWSAAKSVDSDYVNSFIKDYNSFFGSVEKEYSGLSWQNASSAYDGKKSAYDDLVSRAGKLKNYAKVNKKKMDEKSYQDFSSILSQLETSGKSVMDAYGSVKDFYAQFKTEDEYNSWQAASKHNAMIDEINAMDAAAIQEKINSITKGKAEVDQIKEDIKKYELIRDNYFKLAKANGVSASEADKNAKLAKEQGQAEIDRLNERLASYGNVSDIAYTTLDGKNVTWQSLYDKKVFEENFSKQLADAKANPNYAKLVEEANGMMGNLDKYGKLTMGQNRVATLIRWGDKMTEIAAMAGASPKNSLLQEASLVKQMKQEEADLYGYLLLYAGEKEANNYYNNLKPILEERSLGATLEQWQGFADDFPVLSSVVSVGTNLASGLEYISDLFTGDQYSTSSAITSTIRGTVSEKVNWEIGHWDAFDFIYNTGMSAADSFVAGTAFGPTGAGVTLGLSAAASGTNNALERGLTKEQAFWNGLSSGIFEGLFETVSLGQFSALKQSFAFGGKEIAKNIAKSMLVNASEEMATEAANIVYDIIANGDFSHYETTVRMYMAQGMSEEDAKWNAALDLGAQIAESGASGALMGFGFGAIGNLHGYRNAIQNAKENYSNIEKDLVNEALAIDPNYAFAKKMQTILDQGKSLSGVQIQRLINHNESGKSKIHEPDNTDVHQTSNIAPDEYSEDIDDSVTDEETASPVTETSDLPEADVKTDSESNSNTVAEEAADGDFEAVADTAENADAEDTKAEESATVSLSEASQKYGAQAQAMIHTYTEGQDVTKYDAAYQVAYDMGKSGVSLSYTMNSNATAYLSEKQRELAYEAGKAAADTTAKEQDAENKKAVNGRTGRRKGTVKGEGVKIADLKKSFNDTQNTAYKVLVTAAEATGIDIVLYKSETDENGNFIGSQGKFKHSENTIYIDVNAGLKNIKDVNDLAKYAMLRTFSHEFTHFIEKWNPIWYNEFRKVVFDTLTERGENVHDLIEEKQAATPGMTYDEASREVVAEAMTDILPDANFVETLATKHKNVFEKLLAKIKEFLADIKAYFSTLGHNRSKEANALKEQVGEAVHYVENIVKLFDKVAVEAVENYQATVATEEATTTNNTDGGNDETVNRGTETGIPESESGTRGKDENRSQVQSDMGEKTSGLPETRETSDGLHNRRREVTHPKDYTEDDFVHPKKGSALHTLQSKALEEYDLKCHIVKESSWGRDSEAFIYQNEIYAVETISEDSLKDVIPHEGTHAMNLTKFKPYLDFLERTPEMVNFHSEGISELVNDVQEHLRKKKHDFDFLTMKEEERDVFYDELNAYVYGLTKGGALEDSNYDYGEWLPGAFHDFDAYINELTSIHEQFKAERKGRPQAEVKDDVYERLRTPLGNLPRFSTGGFLFRIYKNGETWQGHIDKVNESEGGYPVSDARGIHYKSEIFTNRQDAIDDIVAVARNNKLLEPRAETTATNTKEVNQNGENADNRETVRQPDTDRQGDSQVLDELQAEDVQGNVQGGDSVGDPVERGQETRRDDVRDGSGTGTRSGSSLGDSQSGDLRRNDELTPEAAEKLHEEVTEQIAQTSTELPKGRNFVIGDSLSLPNGEKARYKANIEAIRLVKQLEAEGRYATEAEQIILSKYVGWGGLKNAFEKHQTNWTKEYNELKELLTDEEYRAASASTLNAHYTDISVIKAMYDGLRQLGFNGGRMMEPSSGVGNFVGAMPEDMSAKVKSWTMVELDSITGLIAKYLYPNADVRIQGFEKANIPDNFMDVIISNVPFGDYPITDKAYPKRITRAIHNYFFAKSLDKVRPGGIVMFITSSYTMNSKEEAVRQYIMQRADLLGAIRLPDTAFKGNAGTEVVTDILILKKRVANTPYAGEDFLSAPWGYPVKGNYNGAYVNSYFNNHPEMVLGTASMEGSMYRSASLTYKALEGKGSLADQIREAFSHIKGKMDYPAQQSPEKTNFAVERASKKTKQDGFVAKDGKIYQNKDGNLVEKTVTPKVAERIKGMLEIRDAAKALMTAQQQGLKESEIKKARTALNKLYDAFVKKNGFLNAPANKSAFADDPDRYSLFALENWNPDKKSATKTDIFSKNTIAPNRTVTSAKDVSEGLIVSVNQTGGVDVPLIAALTSKSVPDVTRELLDSRQAFKNRNGQLETAETYLSGNVRAKLRDAEALAIMDADYEKNVEALKAVIPEDVPYQDIFVNPGTPWIPSSVYSDFAAYMLGGRNNDWKRDVDVTRNASTGNFTVELKSYYLKTNAANTQKWGTPRRSFLELFDAMLNSKSVVIRYKLDDGTTVVDKDATAAANEKIENITKEFQDWLWRDEARRTELAALYNETFNSIVIPKYNGDNLSVNGANAMKPLRPHQRNAVQRVISSGGNTLLAHKVGAGKTYEMAASAMKLKELGLVKKPMFAVPKSLVAQWGTEFIDFFPTAKLLVAEASDFTAANRKVFMNRIANGDYDAVIVSYEQFEKLPISDDFAKELYQEEMDSVIAAIEEAKAEKGAKAMSIKDLEKKRKSLQAKIDKLTDKAKDEGNIDFEQLGVDSLFIDEAHNFKNLFYTTSMTNVSGLGNKDGSKRAFDLYTKVRYLQKLNGGKGIVFATATPVMNSMSEMYIMQKYLQPDLLNQLGLSTFDAWAKQFGEVVNGVEIKPSGQGYRVKQSFSRFKNMSELQLLFRNFADVLTDIPGLKIPKMKGGAVQVVVCEPGEFQKNYMKELEKRADNVKNVDPSVDNMLKITSDGRKISYTQRMIEPTLPYEEGCKIYRCADNVVTGYNDSNKIKGTQLIFCDMATPKGKSKTETTETDDSTMDMESAKLYDDLRARLVQGGIPAKEIAFIHEADTDQKKKKLFADVNDGKVRVLIGSTGKMGVGMNAQKRVVSIHHLDAPWRPGDVEQRNGRAFRQGNINDEVECFTYVTEGSFDARLWDILERKQNFINQVMNGESVGRETEDTGEVTLSAAEVKALASGSPLIMEQVQLDTDIKKLESLYRAHRSSIRAAKDRLEKDRGTVGSLERQIELGKADMKATKDTYSEGNFSIRVGKQTFTEKKDAGVALMAAATAKADFSYTTIGSFAGFDVRVIKTTEGIKGVIAGKQSYSFNTYPNNTTFMINHMISVVESISERVTMWENQLEETKADIQEQEKLIGEPFAKQAELDEKRKRYNEVMAILNPKEEQALDSVDDDAVQEQSREYLGEVQEQQRTDTLTDREVLEMAANEVKVSDLTQAEQDALTIFQNRLSKLKDLQDKRAEQGKLYKEQQFGTKPDRSAAEATLNRMHILDEQIKRATSDVLSVEEKEVLKRVLQKARKVVTAEERQHGQEMLSRWRDRRNNADAIKKYRDRIRGDVDELSNWILKPNNKDIVKHVPDVLKNSVIPFLSSINFMSKRSLNGGDATKADKEFVKRLDALKLAIKTNIDVHGMYSGYNDLPPNFMDDLDNIIKTAQALVDKNSGEFIINQMTSEELKSLSKMVRFLKKYITQINRFHYNAMYQHVYEAGDSSIEFLEKLNNAGSHTGGLSNFLFWQQIRPAYAFERFGKGGEAIYDELRRGQARLAFNTKEIERFTKNAYTAKEVNAWEKEIKTFRLGADNVKMPVSYIMGLYELSKDPQALVHIHGEGIRVATYTNRGKKISDVGHTITPVELNQILNSLTPRQREVADSLQKYMAEQGGKWGNYVSVARFGEELFTNKNYYPINSDGRHLQATADEHPSAAALYALLNMSFTKSRQEGANNRIVIYSIFDVFANHMASMAQYNAMALPVLDALKWFNYKQVFIDDQGNKTVIANIREQMDRVYGVPEETKPGKGKDGYAQSFVMNIIKAFNGTEAQGTPYDSFGLKSLHRYNIAQVAYNLRVVVQQPMAITRAGMLLDYRSMMKGMKRKPSAIKHSIEEMQKYSGIAAWKSLGFYDVNISRGLTKLIKHDSTALDKIDDIGMWGAEKADLLTWAAMWSAAKEEVKKKQRLTPESEGFYEAVTKLFEDVIYKTQVVDSVLTKNEFMRDKGTFARLVGSFMSEPTTNASMLIDAIDKYNLDRKRGMTSRDAWQKNRKMIGRRLYVYGVGAVLLAAVQAAADALRDDDEYEEYDEKWLEAFSGNLIDELMPFNKLPILSDFYDLAKELASIFGVDTYGNPPQSVFMQWYDSLAKGTEIIYDKIMGEDINYTWYGGIYKMLQAVSGMSGLPMAAATREIITFWNNTVGAMAPSLKIKSYEPSELAEIRYAYEDGYLTYEEATTLLLEKGLVDNENEAYFTIQGWEAGGEYSRYDKIYDAVRNGGSITEAMNELTSHGYTEEDVLGQVKSQIGKWYQEGEISKSQAINMLTKYFDMSDEEITATVNKWSSVVVTGIKYNEIEEKYLDQKITAQRAAEMLVRYGGLTKQEAMAKVTYWRFKNDLPDVDLELTWFETYYSDIASSGMEIEDYITYRNKVRSITGEGKKARRMAVIHSMPISRAQKDALYYAEGWARSTINEAPWH